MGPVQLLAPKFIGLIGIPFFLHVEAPEVCSADRVSLPYASELQFGNNKFSLMQCHAEAFLKDFL